MPGEPVELGPSAGDTLAVVGVAYDDVLNLRAAPGADQEILKRIPPLFDDLTALGETRNLPRSFWIAVDYEGTEGWVNLRYIGYLGKTTDVTPEYVDGLTAADMVELGMMVAEASGYDQADVVVSSAPTQGDPGEITVDLLGLEDDSVRGSAVPCRRPTDRERVHPRQSGVDSDLWARRRWRRHLRMTWSVRLQVTLQNDEPGSASSAASVWPSLS